MTALLRLLVLVPLGYIAAVLAAAFTITFGAMAYGQHGYTGFFTGALVAATLYVGAASFVPALIAIAVSEMFRLRSLFYFLLVGGAIDLVTRELAGFVATAEFFGHRQVLVLAGGFVGGFVYWLIVGMNAGLAGPNASRRGSAT